MDAMMVWSPAVLGRTKITGSRQTVGCNCLSPFVSLNSPFTKSP